MGGFAYVKFHKASSAALALETINEKGEIEGMRVKVLVADPKAKRRDAPESWPFATQWDAQQDLFVPSPGWNVPPFHPMDVGPMNAMNPCFLPYMVPPVMQVHFVVECDSSVSHEDLQGLFISFDGFESCRYACLTQPDGTLKGVAHVYFTDPQRAMVAVGTSMEPEWAVRLSGVRGKMLLFPPPLLHQGIIPSCYLPTHTILPTLTLLTPLPRNTRVPCSHNILLIFD